MSKKSFTLIELLVVVAIISILASALMVGLGGARKKARDARRISDLRTVQSSLEVYYAQNGIYPDVDGWDDLEDKLTGIISQLPQDPLPGNPNYDYTFCDGGQRYVMQAHLEDAKNCPANYKAPDTTTCNTGLDCDCAGNQNYCVSFK